MIATRWITILFVSLTLPAVWTANADAAEQLAKIRYQVGDRVLDAVAEVTLGSPERIGLRLFNERIAGYYTIHVTHEELLEVHYLTATEAREVALVREAQVKEATIRRDAERDRRRAERVRRAEKKLTRNSSKVSRRSGKSRSSRSKHREEDRRAANVDASIQILDDALRPFSTRLESVISTNDMTCRAIRSISRSRDSSRLINEVLDVKENLDRLSTGLDHRIRQMETLQRTAAKGKVSPKSAEAQVSSVLALLRRMETRLLSAESKVAAHKKRLSRLPVGSPRSVASDAPADEVVVPTKAVPASKRTRAPRAQGSSSRSAPVVVNAAHATNASSVSTSTVSTSSVSADEPRRARSSQAAAKPRVATVSPVTAVRKSARADLEGVAADVAGSSEGGGSTVGLGLLGLAIGLGLLGFRLRNRIGVPLSGPSRAA